MDVDGKMVLAVLKIVAVGAFGVLSSYLLYQNFDILSADTIFTMYSSLFHGLNVNKRIIIVLSAFFVVRRLLLALFTISLNQYIIPSLFIYFYGSIFAVSIGLAHKPVQRRWLNILENANECFIALTGYFALTFSEWIADVYVRTHYGSVFVDMLYAIIIFNFVVIAADVYHVLRLKYLKYIYEIKCVNQIRYKRMKIDELLVKWNVTLPEEIEVNRKLLFVHHID